MAMILSISSPSSGWVAIHWPSRRMDYFIAQLENFFHFMRDIDDTAAAIFQLTDDLKQMVDLSFSVSDDVGSSMMTILAVIGKRLRDLNHLHLRYR